MTDYTYSLTTPPYDFVGFSPAIRKAVATTARMLDTFVPDWFKAIDFSYISFTTWSDCILGQIARRQGLEDGRALFEGLVKQMELSSSSDFQEVRLGIGISSTDHILLKEAWRVEVNTRLASDPNPAPVTYESLEDVSAEIMVKLANDVAFNLTSLSYSHPLAVGVGTW